MSTTSNKIRNTYCKGDILEYSSQRIYTNNACNVIIPHVCNNINVFGGGFAAYLANKQPIIKENFHMLGNKAKLGNVQYVKLFKNSTYRSELIIANMIAQNQTISQHNPRPLNYESLVQCMVNVRHYIRDIASSNDIKFEIHCPKFGSGLAGGDWKFISQLIEDIWFEFPVFIYQK
jgi:hypothetical protein